MDRLDSDKNAHYDLAGFGGIRNLILAKVKKVKIYDIISSSSSDFFLAQILIFPICIFVVL